MNAEEPQSKGARSALPERVLSADAVGETPLGGEKKKHLHGTNPASSLNKLLHVRYKYRQARLATDERAESNINGIRGRGR